MNVQKTYALPLLASLLLILASCSSTHKIAIEIPLKAKQELPERIQKLLLVNRTVDNSYTNTPADTIQLKFYKKKFNVDTLIADKQAADTMLFALGDLLFESGRYDYVIPEDRLLPFKKNAFLTQPMDWKQAKELCETYETDAVLSVDMMKNRIVTRLNQDDYFDPVANGFYKLLEAKMGIVYEALIRIYEPSTEKIIVQEFFRDTLVWEDAATSAKELFSRFTPVKTALTEASIAVAIDFTEKIGPSWREEERQIFAKGSPELKEAGTFIDNNDWDSAITRWKKMVRESKSAADKSKALFNLAVAAELEGDITQAIKLGLESYNTLFRQETYDYLKHLEKRRKEIQNQLK